MSSHSAGTILYKDRELIRNIILELSSRSDTGGMSFTLSMYKAILLKRLNAGSKASRTYIKDHRGPSKRRAMKEIEKGLCTSLRV